LAVVYIVLATAAGAMAEPAAEEIPAATRAVLAEAGRLIDQKEYAKAIARLKAYQAESKERHPMTDFALGNCYLLQENNDAARQAFERVVALRPEMASARLNLAKACYDGGRHAEAGKHFVEAYDRAAEKKPEHLYYGAAALLMARQYGPAIAAFDRLFQAHPNDIQPKWKEHWVHALLAGGQGRRALPVIQALIEQYTGDERVRWQEILIHQYMDLKMHAEAGAYVTGLSRRNPETARWWKLRGQIALAGGDDAGALAALTIYGFLTPLSAEERKLWADLSLQAGIPCQAAPAYEALLKEKPDRQMLKHLALACQRMGDSQAALAHLERHEASGQDPEMLMLRGDLLYGLKRFADAAATYRRAAQQNHPRAGHAWLMAGYAAWQAEDLPTSRQAFGRAAAFADQRKTALAAMRQLEKIN
jgi:tetratricopeptide (TPR) repeat protein